MNILEQLKADKAEAELQMLKDYYALLQGFESNPPTPADRANLGQLINALHHNPERLEKDLQEVQYVRQLIINASDLEGKKARKDIAERKQAATFAERQEANKAINAKVMIAVEEFQQADNAYTVANQSTGELIRLKESNPALYDAIVATNAGATPIAPIPPKKRKIFGI